MNTDHFKSKRAHRQYLHMLVQYRTFYFIVSVDSNTGRQIKGVRSVDNPCVLGEMTLWGIREWYGQGQQRTEKVGGL